MKIIYTVHQFYPKSHTGTEKFVLNSAKMQQKCGNKVKVITFGLDSKDTYDKTYGDIIYKEFIYEGIEVLEFRHSKKENHLNEIIGDPDCKDFAKFVLSNEQPDVMHVGHTMRVSEFILYAIEHNIPYIMTLTDFWLFCLKTIMLNNNMICEGCDRGQKCAEQCHPLLDFCQNRYQMAKHILMNACVVASPSQFLADMFEKEFDGLKVKVINHGMSIEKLIPNTKTYNKDNLITFGYAGSLTYHKGVHMIIKAFNKIGGKHKLKIYGGGPDNYIKEIKKLASGNRNIEFCGVYSTKEITSVFHSCDVMIIPSIWYENYPLVLHEALVSQVPVITSNIGGMSEKIIDNYNGYTFEVGNWKDLQSKMNMVIKNPAVLNTFKTNISKYVSPSIEQEAYTYFCIFNDIIKNKEQLSH